MSKGKNGNGASRTRTIKVDYLARVEGEGGLFVKIRDNAVRDVQLKIFEPPRFFEAFLRGRSFREAPDITARICGICPVAYMMSACHAMEDAAGVTIDGPIREMRRLIYCGEWIESHALHVYMLHAPDFLGYEDAIRMAKDHPEMVRKGLELKKLGNDLITFIAGREVHPVNVRVGGFYKAPTVAELRTLEKPMQRAADIARETIEWSAGFSFPDFDQEYEYVALRHADEYPYNEGRIVSSRGLDIAASEFNEHFREQHVEHSNALHCVTKDGRPYFVGPLARYNLNFDRLSPSVREAALAAGLGEACHNPFRSIIVRAVELLHACEEALRVIRSYERPERPYVEAQPRDAVGHGCTEAPRGLLYHRYQLDGEGRILDAKIVPPTSQNQKTIEKDLWGYVEQYVAEPPDRLKWQCEQAIRNYDPCISCATHFLRLDLDRA